MQIGFVGLGRMGGNMVTRIRRDSEHEVVAYDRGADAVKAAVSHGASGARSLANLVKAAAPAAHRLGDGARGRRDEKTSPSSLACSSATTRSSTAATRSWTDDKRRAAELEKKGIHYVDVGTSGGVWGLEVGYCMMVGGAPKAVKRLAPILDVLAPETDERQPRGDRPAGWRTSARAGAGHYVKMVHNGVEYGLMQAYAEGFDIFAQVRVPARQREDRPPVGPGARWSARGCCELAARAFEQDGNDLATLNGYVDDSGEGRWTIEDATAHDVPTPVISASLYSRFYSRGNGDYAAPRARRTAQPVRRTRGQRRRPVSAMTVTGAAHRTRSRRASSASRSADDARDLRRDRRPRPAQAAAGDLQPRPRGRAARALQPDRRLARRA